MYTKNNVSSGIFHVIHCHYTLSGGKYMTVKPVHAYSVMHILFSSQIFLRLIVP